MDGYVQSIDDSQDDKNDADLRSNSAEKPNNAPIPNNKSYLVVDSGQNGVKNTDLENNNMVYNHTSYELDKNSLHNNQEHTNNPNGVISSYHTIQTRARPGQAKGQRDNER